MSNSKIASSPERLRAEFAGRKPVPSLRVYGKVKADCLTTRLDRHFPEPAPTPGPPVEGSLLGGVTYNLGDMRGGSHSRSWWEDSLWRSHSLDGDVRGGSHSRSWHRRCMAVSQASCQLLSASTSVQSSSCLTRLRV